MKAHLASQHRVGEHGDLRPDEDQVILVDDDEGATANEVDQPTLICLKCYINSCLFVFSFQESSQMPSVVPLNANKEVVPKPTRGSASIVQSFKNVATYSGKL
jgi:hypothetical protein